VKLSGTSVFHTRRLLQLFLAAFTALVGCDRAPESRATIKQEEEPSPSFRNVGTTTSYVGDAACATCHAEATSTYRQHAMASSFHRWTRDVRIETPLDTPLYHGPTGLHYSVADVDGRLYQIEFLIGPGGKRLHELRKRIDYVMGSGYIARTYFTEENGRLFQLPLTWYRQHGWDFSPGYELNNARFDRVMPDRCIACHSSYPEPIPFLEGKFAELRPGIGCERCHGPGALHVMERRAAIQRDTGYDNTIVNPARLPLERRLDVCEQCHVHTPVTVLREGKDAFSYVPSQSLRDYAAFFKVTGSIDLVSHADRLRQSACFLATRTTARPLECATCHDPHSSAPDSRARTQTCQSCHSAAVLEQRLARSTSRAAHGPTADCVSCHMPTVKERTVPHGAFTDHWIRVVAERSRQPAARRANGLPIEPYYERDKTGPEATVYQSMGGIVYATRASDARALADAAVALDRALENDTTRDDAHFFVGVAYEQLGRTDAAIRALERSVRADSNHPERLRALAQAYERGGRGPAAIDSLYRRALALQPALAWIRADYADFLHAQDRRSEAEAAYRAALAEQPSLAVARFNLGTLLSEDGRVREASDAFREAIHRDPLLAEALSRLLEIRTVGKVVSGVKGLDTPLPTLPVRSRHPRAVQMTIATDAARPGARFLNVPPGGFMQILEPNGTLVRALPAAAGGTASWDLLTDTGNPIAGGVYQARVHGRDASGRPLAPQLLHFSVLRRSRE
jgi:Tfp pilus assembly protein PilF